MKSFSRVFVVILLMLLLSTILGFAIDDNSKAAVFNNITIGEDEVIDEDVAAVFGDVIVNGRVKGDVAAVFGDVIVNGVVDGDAAAVFGSFTANGEIGGDVAAVFGCLKIKDSAKIMGDVAAIGGGLDKSPEAKLYGEISDVGVPFAFGKFDAPRFTTMSIIGLLITYGLSALVLAIIPDRVFYMAGESRIKYGRRFGIGILGFLLFIPIIVALAISIIGILAIPFFILAFVLTVFIGGVSIKYELGKITAGHMEDKNSQYIYLLVGVVIIYAIKFVPVVGFLLGLFISVLGLGIVIDTKFGGKVLPKPYVYEGPAEAIKPNDIQKRGGDE